MTERGLDHVAELEVLADELLEVDGDEDGMIVPLMAAAAAVAIGVLALLIRRRANAPAGTRATITAPLRAPPMLSANSLALGVGQSSVLGVVFEESETIPDPRTLWSVAYGREELVERIPPRRRALP